MDIPNTVDHLFWGYLLIWLGVAGYQLLVAVEQRRLRHRLDQLSNSLAEIRSNSSLICSKGSE